MSKGAVGLVAGYWPEDIYRYLAIPGLSLDEGVVVRPARRRPDHPALALDARAIGYRQLSQDVDRASALLRAAVGPAGRVALVASDPLDTARLLLGALRGRHVACLLDPSAPSGLVRTQIQSFQPSLVIADEAQAEFVVPGSGEGWRTLTAEAFWAGEAGPTAAAGRVDLKAAALALVGSEGRLVYHSHSSLVAWAVSWSAFVPLTDESVVLILEPLWRWSALAAALAVLFRGGTAVLAGPDVAPELTATLRQYHPAYVVLRLADAERLASEGGAVLRTALRESVAGAFTVVDRPFATRVRRRGEAGLGVPSLTLLGDAAAGPVLASHPTWYVDEAVGIPVTNVDVWPLSTVSREPLPVPWEAIEYGEVGVRSPLVAVDYQAAEDRDRRVTGAWVRMGVVATMDPNGLFYLRS